MLCHLLLATDHADCWKQACVLCSLSKQMWSPGHMVSGKIAWGYAYKYEKDKNSLSSVRAGLSSL